MFLNCSSLKAINLNSFDTTNTIAMNDMFKGCTSLEELETLGEEIGVTIRCQRADIFEKMHRI